MRDNFLKNMAQWCTFWKARIFVSKMWRSGAVLLMRWCNFFAEITVQWCGGTKISKK